MISGEYSHNLDSKGRVIIPSKFRKQLGEKFVITKGFDNCLFVYSSKDWSNFEKKLSSLSLTNKDARNVSRFFVGSAIDTTFDKMGRILINSSLKEYANIEKEVVIVGMIDRVEIWDKNAWIRVNKQITKSIDSIVDNLNNDGLDL